jgi:sugar (pentulose or hexulose) kinase
LLPEVVPPGTLTGHIESQWSKRWGFSPDTGIVSGTTDSTAGFLATGAGPGQAVTSLGSTLVIKICSKQPVYSPRYGIYSHRLGERWLVGGASNTGGAVLLKYFGLETIGKLTAHTNPLRPTGLDYYPLVSPGERFPVSDPDLVPRLQPRPANDAEFFQGMLEGMARIEKQGYERLEELGAPWPKQVITVGGGAANAGWQTIREQLLGVPVVKARQSEAAYGSALLAREAVTINT